MKIDTTEITWYEDGELLEWWSGEGGPEDKKYKYCSLEDAIQFAWENRVCLYIQPAIQDAGLFIDYSE